MLFISRAHQNLMPVVDGAAGDRQIVGRHRLSCPAQLGKELRPHLCDGKGEGQHWNLLLEAFQFRFSSQCRFDGVGKMNAGKQLSLLQSSGNSLRISPTAPGAPRVQGSNLEISAI